MQILKETGRAALVGGLLGLMAEVVRQIFLLILGSESSLVIPFTLIVMCLFAVVTYPSGIYGKWTQFGFVGAMLPISGLTSGVSAAYCGAYEATGSKKAGIIAGIMLVVRLSGSGLVAALIVALILSFAL